MRQVALGCNQSYWSSQVILGRNQPSCDSMLEMAKVKFEYFKEKLGVLKIEVSSKRRWWRLRAILTRWEDWFLPWSYVRDEPFYHGERIWFLTCQIWVPSHSDVTIELVSTWSNVRAKCYSRNGGAWSVTRKTQSRTENPFWCDRGMCSHLIRCKGWIILSWLKY